MKSKYDENEDLLKYLDSNISQYERDRRRAVISLIPEDADSVLDIGCGTGAISNELNNPIVVGLDYSQTALRQYRQDCVHASADNIPFATHAFEIIVLSEVLEHLDDTAFKKCINDIIRLEPSIILIASPYIEKLEARMSRCDKCGNIFHMYHHKISLSPEDIDSVLNVYQRKNLILLGNEPIVSDWILSLERKFNVFYTTLLERCENCGSNVPPQSVLIRYPFTFLRKIDSIINRLRGRTSPIHMILKYARK